jgi:hypothetical protein
MATQTDVKASKELATTGAFRNTADTANLGRVRIKGLHIVPGATAGSISITDGNGGPVLLAISTPAVANAGAYPILLPGEGILAETGPYATLTTVTGVTLFYG